MDSLKCKICSSNATEESRVSDGLLINCSHCGRYFISDSLRLEKYDEKLNFYKLSCWIYEQHHKHHISIPEITEINIENLLELKEKEIQNKFNLMMHYLSSLEEYEELSHNILLQCWIKDTEELHTLFKKGVDVGFIEGEVHKAFSFPFFTRITSNGLAYVKSPDSVEEVSNNVFSSLNNYQHTTAVENTL